MLNTPYRLLALLAALALLSPTLAAERPNIVLILADDLGYETVGCYGGTSYETPRLDQLAHDGIRFDRAYAMPLCTNTRIQLMTGKYNIRNWKAFGILDPNAVTFGHALQSTGYKTCIAGKWQLTSYDPPDYPGSDTRRNTGMRIAEAGFDQYSLWHTGHTETKGSRYADPIIEQNGRLLADTDGEYGPDLWTDFICDFMTDHREEPFFVYYSMALPHNPMNPTPDSPEWQDPSQRHDDITRYAGDMIEYTDKMVGKLVDHVDSLGLSQQTLVIFFSDNGTNYRVRSDFRGQTVGGEKGKGTELGIRVPMIVRWPGTIAPTQTSQALIDSVDVFPTLLDVAGAKEQVPQDCDGVSFAPVWQDPTTTVRDHVYIHQDPRPGWDKDRFQLIRLAINDGYKLYEDGRLIDLTTDFYERSPIWPRHDSPSQSVARRALENALAAYMPYPMFDPSEVPRPDPNAQYDKHAFEDAGGYVVVEAERIPFGRDESWLVENHAPDFTGLGYLRALRNQSKPGQLGVARIPLSIESEGDYRIAVRCRLDRSPESTGEFFFRHEDHAWQTVQLPEGALNGDWCWCILDASVHLHERRNTFFIAPATQNLKVDRLVFYRPSLSELALSPVARAAAFHPWASP